MSERIILYSCIPIRLESPIISLPLLHTFLCTVVPADAVCHGIKTGLSEITLVLVYEY